MKRLYLSNQKKKTTIPYLLRALKTDGERDRNIENV